MVYSYPCSPQAEKAKAVIKANGLEDRITVYGKRSTDIHVGAELPAPVDVVVTETMGTDLLSEAMYFSLHDAVKRLTTPDVVLIPSTGRVLAQLIEVPERWHMDGFAIPKEGGLDMRPLNTLLPNFWSMVQMKKVCVGGKAKLSGWSGIQWVCPWPSLGLEGPHEESTPRMFPLPVGRRTNKQFVYRNSHQFSDFPLRITSGGQFSDVGGWPGQSAGAISCIFPP